ncbi:hypothetical protein ACFSKM_03340 [Ancylobacter dichloromethanicus]
MIGYAEETNRLNRERRSNGDAWKAELVKVERQVRGIIEAIKAGMFHESMKAEMDTSEARKNELSKLLVDVPNDVPDMLARAVAIYASKVATLTHALNRPEEKPQAAEALRMPIERIVLTPGNEQGEIFAALHGELRTILEWTERQAIGMTGTKQNPQPRLRVCRYQWLRGTQPSQIAVSSRSVVTCWAFFPDSRPTGRPARARRRRFRA